MKIVTGQSILAFHHWAFLPGRIAALRRDDGRTMATIKSHAVGEHEYVDVRAVFASLNDAQRAAEKVVGALK